MSMWTFLAIFLTAAVIGEVFKQRYKAMAKTGMGIEPKLQELEQRYNVEIEALRKRVRNLETIAASDPDEFSRKSASFDSGMDIHDETDAEELNERLVNQLARKRTR